MPRVLTAIETAALLPFDALVSAVARAAVDKATGAMHCPDRLVVPLAGDATMLAMPAVAADVAIHKLITVVPGNRRDGRDRLPAIQGTMTVLEPGTGEVTMVLDGPTVTGRRTAAVSMCAIDLLAGAVRSLLLVGTGAQASHHVDALAALRPDIRVRVRGTSREAATRFLAVHRHRMADIDHVTETADFDVVVTCTSSATPVYDRPARIGTLIVAIGSFRCQHAEIDGATVRDSDITVDDLDGARHEAGDLIRAGVDWQTIATLADRIRSGDDRTPGSAQRPQLFKSVGCSAWDLAAARVALAVRDA